MLDDIRLCLRDVGLSPKAINMYLSLLELGASNVQELAKKANVNRTTAYLVLEELKRFSLLATVEKNLKTYYSAENPERLLFAAKTEVENKQHVLARLEKSLPRLVAMHQSVQDRPRVRLLEGDDAVRFIRTEVIQSGKPVCEFLSIDEASQGLSSLDEEHRIYTSTQTTGRLLVAIKEGCRMPYLNVSTYEVRACAYAAHPFSGCVSFTDERVYMFSLRSKGIVLVVESKELVGIFQALFEHVWDQASLWVPPEHWPKR